MSSFAAAAVGLAASNAAPRPTPAWPAGIRHRARVLYDGKGYSGMQIQPQIRTVAGELERKHTPLIYSFLFIKPHAGIATRQGAGYARINIKVVFSGCRV